MKKLAILALTLMMALSLAAMGCQKKEEAAKPAEAPTAAPAPAPAPEKEGAPAPAPEKKEEPAKKKTGGY